ncbi:hypothetical protein DICVIV_05808 [Dictyocaulus viviparus]|uniref:Right handed beta helix domain-containing protein n=1 Tax=Dictyocaulus viviparus TaxID=29172 RepID=A0A0D8XWB0_DICVI|nr:hypothetical protein DICVIV_05808 [Dictyocaulus viviparus]
MYDEPSIPFLVLDIKYCFLQIWCHYRVDYESTPFSNSVSADVLAIHFRGTAADGSYGFIAEISAIPSTADSTNADTVIIRGSRIDRNERGAVLYQNVGEMSPAVVIEDCSLSTNGIHLFGNISTSYHAVQLHLHNTMLVLLRGNSLTYNRGGLVISARSSSTIGRLNAVIKHNLFSWNSNNTVVELYGNNFQMVTMLNNIISYNYVLYRDIMKIDGMSVNLTGNVFFSNTGQHTVDSQGGNYCIPGIPDSPQTYKPFYTTVLKKMLLSATAISIWSSLVFFPKFNTTSLSADQEDKLVVSICFIVLEVITQEGVSFDWWAHVDTNSERYRSTILGEI